MCLRVLRTKCTVQFVICTNHHFCYSTEIGEVTMGWIGISDKGENLFRRQFGRLRRRWQDNIKMDFGKTVCKNGRRI
jgi:hypothetical protein